MSTRVKDLECSHLCDHHMIRVQEIRVLGGENWGYLIFFRVYGMIELTRAKGFSK